jgi:hypothetical protein
MQLEDVPAELRELIEKPEDLAQLEEMLAAIETGDLDETILRHGLDFRPTNDDELHAYISAYYGFDIPRVPVCEDHCSPMQAMGDLYFTRVVGHDIVWIGGRGSGKTLDFAIAEHLLISHFADTLVNVGAVEEQAQACYRYIQSFDSKPHFAPNVYRSIISRSEYRNGANLKIIPATKRQVNGPHPRVALWDEVDLTDPAVIDEGRSMPITVKGRPPQTVFTSSLKFAYGPIVKMMDAATSGEKAIKTYRWCVFEIIEKCKPERHRDGEGCRTCPLAPECLESRVDGDGETVLLPGPGKASRSDGFMAIDDVITKYRTLDRDTWDSQWRSKRPSVKGLVYPQFGDHHIVDYKWNPELPTFAAVDFGFTNRTAVLFFQITLDRRIVIFKEWSREMVTSPESAIAFKKMAEGRAAIGSGWIVGDPAAADARAVWQQNGIPIVAADNTKDMSDDNSGISKVRYALAPMGGQQPMLFVDRSCKFTINGFRTYHVKDQKDDRNADEKPVKADDHEMDAARYGIARIIRRRK